MRFSVWMLVSCLILSLGGLVIERVGADLGVSSIVESDLVNPNTNDYLGSSFSESHVSPIGADFQSGNTVYGGNNPTFFTGLMASQSTLSRNQGNTLYTMKVTVTIKDSAGNSLSSLKIGNLGMLTSPQTSGSDWSGVFLDLFDYIASFAKLPAPSPLLKSGAQYTGTGTDPNDVWAQWNWCAPTCPPATSGPDQEQGLNFRYQPIFPSPDIYTISVSTYVLLETWSPSEPGVSLASVSSSYSFQYVYESDANSGNDAGGTFSTALGISLGSYAGLLYGADTVDMYKFDGVAGQTYYYSVVPPVYTIGSSAVSDVKASIYNPGWSLVTSSNLGPGQTNSGSFAASSTGSYYLSASLNNGGGVYSFGISNQPIGNIAPDFSLSASPNPAIFDPYQHAATSSITAGSVNSFSGTISLAFTVSPTTGSSCALSQTSLTLSNNAGSVSLLCGESTLQTYTITLTGTAGRIAHTITVSFINQAGGGGGICPNCPKHT